MRFTGFIGPSYTLNSVNVDCQRCINLYPEMTESGMGKAQEVASLVATPGLRLLLTLAGGVVRGVYTASNGQLFAVGGNKLYRISSNWAATELGTLSTSTGPVSMADSGQRLALVDGSVHGYFWKFATSAYSDIPFPTDIDFVAFAGCAQVVFQDGYFIYSNAGTEQFFISGQVGSIVADDSTIDAADFGSAEGNPDPITGMLSDHRDLWLFNDQSIEVFFNSGATFPFERIQGAFIEHGLAAPFSIAKMNSTVYWVAKDDKGSGVVVQANGYQPARISTHAVENAIRGYGDISDATAYTYQQNGHHFYAINFPTADTTWVFDASTKLWHERVYTNQGLFERHRANCHAFAHDTHVVGDYEDGKIYELDPDTYSDNGSEITRQRISPHVTSGLTRVFYPNFQLDIETGIGLDGIAQGEDPQAMLQWSDDGGHSWSNEHWVSFGRIGNRRARALWRRLGSARDRVFKITITDPVKVTLIGAEFNLMKGAS